MTIFDLQMYTEFEHTGELEAFRELGIYGTLTYSKLHDVSDRRLKVNGIRRCAIVGRGSNLLDEIAKGLKKKKHHAIKINLEFVHTYADDQEYPWIYELANEFSVPILYHTGDPGWLGALLKYAYPLTIYNVAVAYPNMNIVQVHAGNPWFADAALVASKNLNVFQETSALLGGHFRDKSHKRLIERVSTPISSMLNYVDDPGKLLFGSCWPIVHPPFLYSSLPERSIRTTLRSGIFEQR